MSVCRVVEPVPVPEKSEMCSAQSLAEASHLLRMAKSKWEFCLDMCIREFI